MSTESHTGSERLSGPLHGGTGDGLQGAFDPEADIPPLQNGDRLTRDEFERRYAAMPQLKKAELIDGIVYIPTPDPFPLKGLDPKMPSPVSHRRHGLTHFRANYWLACYEARTPHVEGGNNSSVRLEPFSEPQPDLCLLIGPEAGGQCRISPDDFLEGAPELVMEVASTSANYDLHSKLEAYRRNQVREYVVWRVRQRAIDWFILRGAAFEPLPTGTDGLLRSEVFPGLWLDPGALLTGDFRRLEAAVDQGAASPEHAVFVARLEAAARAHRDSSRAER